MQRRIQPILARYQKKIATAIRSGGATETALQGLFNELRAALGPELAGIMAQRSLELTAETGITFDAAVISEEALGWARDYNYQLVTGLTDTTRKLVQQSVSTFVETPGMTRGDLEKLLSPAFGEHRASMIGVTEVTRAYSEATNQHQRLIRDEVGLEMRRIWQTLRDAITCPICGPKHGMPEEDWQAEFPNGPPAHPNCRCSTSLTMDDEETIRAEALAKQTAREKLLREQVAGEKPGVRVPQFTSIDAAEKWAREQGVFADYTDLSVDQARVANEVIADLQDRGELGVRSIRTGLEEANFLHRDSARGLAQWFRWDDKSGEYVEVNRVWINVKRAAESIDDPHMPSASWRGLLQHEISHLEHTSRWTETFGFSEDTIVRANRHLAAPIEMPTDITWDDVMRDVSPQAILNNGEFVAEVRTGVLNDAPYPEYIWQIFDTAVGSEFGIAPWR